GSAELSLAVFSLTSIIISVVKAGHTAVVLLWERHQNQRTATSSTNPPQGESTESNLFSVIKKNDADSDDHGLSPTLQQKAQRMPRQKSSGATPVAVAVAVAVLTRSDDSQDSKSQTWMEKLHKQKPAKNVLERLIAKICSDVKGSGMREQQNRQY
ncbi:membrane-associated protein, putative, partial [Bodo saltans]